MELSLEGNEIDLLQRVLTSWLGDLRMEIADTDRLEWREKLHKDESNGKALLERLKVASPS